MSSLFFPVPKKGKVNLKLYNFIFFNETFLYNTSQHLLMVSTRKRKLKLAKNIVEKQQKVVNPAARDLVMKS